jgi:hypothetical protein
MTFIHDFNGSRVMAGDPRVDFSRVANEYLRRVVATQEGVYALDGSSRVRRFVHGAGGAQG